LRIVYLHQYFNTANMAGGTRSFEFARRLVTMGHSVDMITTDRFGERTTSGWVVTEEDGIQVHWTHVPYSNTMTYGDRMRAFGQYSLLAGSRAASVRPEVVFASSTPLTIAFPGAYTARRCRVPMVLEVRDLWPEVPIALGALRTPLERVAARWLERFAYRNAARVVALSPDMKRGVTATGYPAEKVSVIPNACDIELFASAEIAGEQLRMSESWIGQNPLIVYCGTVGLVNGVEYLVHVAVEMLRLNPEVRFLVVGGGRCLSDVKALAAKLGVLDKNMRFMSELPKSDIPAVLGAATLAISTVIDQPVLHANSANKVFDAMAASTPVVINHEGWLADLFRENSAGLVVPARDSALAARNIDALLRDQDRLSKMRDSSFMLASTRFCRDSLARQLEGVLLDALGESESGTKG